MFTQRSMLCTSKQKPYLERLGNITCLILKDKLRLCEERRWKFAWFKGKPWELRRLNQGRSNENTSTYDNSAGNTTYREFDDKIVKSKYVAHPDTLVDNKELTNCYIFHENE